MFLTVLDRVVYFPLLSLLCTWMVCWKSSRNLVLVAIGVICLQEHSAMPMTPVLLAPCASAL